MARRAASIRVPKILRGYGHCCAFLWLIARRISIELHPVQTVRIKVEAAYKRIDLSEGRRTLMDRWASTLDGTGGAVVPKVRHGEQAKSDRRRWTS